METGKTIILGIITMSAIIAGFVDKQSVVDGCIILGILVFLLNGASIRQESLRKCDERFRECLNSLRQVIPKHDLNCCWNSLFNYSLIVEIHTRLSAL